MYGYRETKKSKPTKVPEECLFHSKPCNVIRMFNIKQSRGRSTMIQMMLEYCKICPNREK